MHLSFLTSTIVTFFFFLLASSFYSPSFSVRLKLSCFCLSLLNFVRLIPPHLLQNKTLSCPFPTYLFEDVKLSAAFLRLASLFVFLALCFHFSLINNRSFALLLNFEMKRRPASVYFSPSLHFNCSLFTLLFLLTFFLKRKNMNTNFLFIYSGFATSLIF